MVDVADEWPEDRPVLGLDHHQLDAGIEIPLVPPVRDALLLLGGATACANAFG